MAKSYSDFVMSLCKKGTDICQELTPIRAHTLHMAVGVAGEAGELLDAIKKGAIYGKNLDYPNIIEELGDIEFYMEGLRCGLGITRDEVIEANVRKLSARYPNNTYTNEDAVKRADKQ